MKTSLPSQKGFAKAIFKGKLSLLFFAVFFCFGQSVYAGVKPAYKNRHAGNSYSRADKVGAIGTLSGENATTIKTKKPGVFAGPTISYIGPQTYYTNITITPLDPTSSGVAAFGFSNSPVTLGSGFINPSGIAIDAAGNIYIADAGSTVIKKIPAGGGAITSLGSGFNHPGGVAVDAAGNVYVADSGNNTVTEIPIGGGALINLGSGNLSNPTGVAVDAAGNVYVADQGDSRVVEITVGGGFPTNIGYDFSNPVGVAIDAAGNIYVADAGNNKIVEVPAGNNTEFTVASVFNTPQGVAIDAAGNIYVADSGDNAISMIPVGGGSPVTLGAGFSNPTGVAVDRAGNVYAADQGNVAVKEIVPLGGYFISSPLPSGLIFSNATGTISGTPAALSPAANYTVTAYNASGSSSATLNIQVKIPPAPTISYASPQTYTAGTGITALVPTSSLVANAGNSTNQITLGSGLSTPTGVAVSNTGDIYVADFGNHVVKKIGGGTVGSGFSSPAGVAVDAAGNVYVADEGGGTITKVPVGGGAQVVLASGLSDPIGVAVDGTGNVYVAEEGNSMVLEIPVGGGLPVSLGFGYNHPSGVAVDSQGNVYVADTYNNAVEVIPVGSTTPIAVRSGFSQPFGIAVDAAGDIFVADYGNYQVEEIPPGGGNMVYIGPGGYRTYGVAVDGKGNVYFADQYDSAIEEFPALGGYYISPFLPAGLSFSTVNGDITGTPAVPSPATNYTVTACNAGGGTSTVVNIKVNPQPVPTISYASPQTYIVSAAIPALSPTSNGVAPFAYSNTPVVLGSDFGSPTGVALDAAGNIYVADYINSTVEKIPVGGGSPVSVGSGFSFPVAVAADAAGDVYVADLGSNSIKEVPAGGGATVTVATGFSSPYGVAIDAAGNIYVGDSGNNAVKKIPAGGGAIVTIGSGFSQPANVAVDVAGNVYVADQGNNAIKEIPVAGGSPVTLGSGFNGPLGVAVDVSGNVYVGDLNNNEVKMIPAGNGAPLTIGILFSGPAGVAVDGAGNVIVADAGSNSVKQIEPAGGYFINAVLPAGLSFSNTTGTISGTPTAKSPATNYTVTAYNGGGGGTAIANITVGANANLAGLKISNGSLSSAFAPGTINYEVSVGNSVTTETVTPTSADPAATVKVNGTAVTSGTASGPITLNVGANVITIIVTASDGTTTKTYSIDVTRAPSTNATLALLQISGQSISPTFATGTTSYTSTVSNATTSVKVEAFTNSSVATLTINGNAVASGTASPALPLNIGNNTITAVVTAQDGVTKDTYTITVNRQPSNNATLALLQISGQTISPTFATGTTSYTSNVSNTTASIKVEAFTNSSVATLTINGNAVASGAASPSLPLNVGNNTITTVVTAQDGVTKDTYTIIVNRSATSNNATLALLQISGQTISPAFATGTTSYTLTVSNATTSIKAEAFTNDAHATLTINGNAVASGAASPALPLNVGNNTITTMVTAQDGITTKTYTITVTRQPSTTATLALLQISGQTISPTFATGTTSYTSTVSNATTSIKVEAFTNSSVATLTINGNAVASGAASPALPLNVGNNTITTIVTAQDGVTKDTYTITVTRQPSNNATLALLQISGQTISPTFATGTTGYTSNVTNATASIKVEAFTNSAVATLTINGNAVASGAASPALPLNVGNNTITTIVTAQDGVTKDTYTITVTRAMPSVNTMYEPISVVKPADSVAIENDGVVVHQGVSPNGDGINDFLLIEGITAYPDNHLMIIDRNGTVVYQAKGYDNSTRVFDGHSNINGSMQLSGTYFYSLDYFAKGSGKHKTGFIILKY